MVLVAARAAAEQGAMMRRFVDLVIVAMFAAGMAWVLLAPSAIPGGAGGRTVDVPAKSCTTDAECVRLFGPEPGQ